jgi:hypothetical protein
MLPHSIAIYPYIICHYANTWTDIIKLKKHPDKEKSEWIISESLHNFSEHFNK